jgi:hypothetical protein
LTGRSGDTSFESDACDHDADDKPAPENPQPFIGSPDEAECMSCENGCTTGATLLQRGIDFRICLGAGVDGNLVGALRIQRTRPGVAAGTPAALRFTNNRADIEVIKNGAVLRQVKAPLVLADIETITDDKYSVKLYSPSSCGTKVDGYWAHISDPYVTWIIENPDTSPSTYNRLRISKFVGSSSSAEVRYDYVWTESTLTWELTTYDSQDNPQRVETRAESTDAQANQVDTYERRVNGALIYRVIETYRVTNVGPVLISSEVGPSSNPVIVCRETYEDPADAGKYQRFKSFSNPDGSWVMLDYDAQGRVITRISSFKDVVMPATLDTNVARTIQYSFAPIASQSDDDGSLAPDMPRTETESILGIVIRKTYHAYYVDAQSGDEVEIVERCADVANAYGNSQNLRTTTRYIPAGANQAPPRRIKSVITPDGRSDTYTYEQGTYTSSDPAGTLGTFTVGSGTDLRTTVTHGTSANPDGVTNKTTSEVAVANGAGIDLETASYVYNGSGYELLNWTVRLLDDRGRVTDEYHSNGTHTITAWDCCVQTSEADESGIVTTFAYDELGRLLSQTKTGVVASGSYPAQADITTSTGTAADSNGYVTTTTVSSNGLSTSRSTYYDSAGRTIKSVDAAGLETTYEYSTATSGGRIQSIATPGQGTRVTEYYLDGQVKQVTGTGVVHQFTDYGVNVDHTQWTKVYTGPDLGTSPAWEVTTRDVLGRTLQEQKPGYNGSVVTTTYEYCTDNSAGNSIGQVKRVSRAGSAPMMTCYDCLGKVLRIGLDIDNDGALSLVSMDRIQEAETVYDKVQSDWWLLQTTRVYSVSNNGTPTTTSTKKKRLTGFANGVVEESISVDANNNETRTLFECDPSNQLSAQTVTYPDSGLDAVTVTRNGLVQTVTSKTGVTTANFYDALGRQTGLMDGRSNMTTTVYNSLGQTESVTNGAGNQTAYSYVSAHQNHY